MAGGGAMGGAAVELTERSDGTYALAISLGGGGSAAADAADARAGRLQRMGSVPSLRPGGGSGLRPGGASLRPAGPLAPPSPKPSGSSAAGGPAQKYRYTKEELLKACQG